MNSETLIHRPLRRLGLTISLVLGLVVLCGLCRAIPPDLILVNGHVFTADPAALRCEAVAIGGRHIVATGTSKEIEELAGENTKRIDVGGRVVVPGFNDAHYHHMPNPAGVEMNLSAPEPSWAEVLAALPDAVKKAPHGGWIYGRVGSVVVNDAESSRAALDRLAPEHPVLIYTYYGHGNILNSQGMRRLNVADDEPDPMGGHWEREPGSRRTNGKFHEYAGWPVFRRLEDSCTDEEIIQSLHELADEAARFGVTSIQNMTYLTLHRYASLLGQAKFSVRMRVIRFPATDARGRDLKDGVDLPQHPRESPSVTVSGTKWILDGTPLERGMAIRGEYRDRPDWSGTLNFPASEIQSMLRETMARNDQLLLHAVGDKTIETVLRAMLAVDPNEAHWPSRRVRLEHGDGLQPDLVPLAKRLGVIVVQNPAHLDPGMSHAIERLGPNPPYFALRSLIDAGIPVALGSDGPMSPGLNIMLASIHPLRPAEALSREQAVIAYTNGSAYAEFEEQEKGTLTAGKLADLAVLSQDIFAVPTPELPKMQSVLTMVDGKIIYDVGVLRSTIEPAKIP